MSVEDYLSKEKNMKVATVIPLHPPKFELCKKFLNSAEMYTKNHDVYILFSTHEESINFTCENKHIKIVLPYRWKQFSSVVNAKKFYGLLQINQDYDFVAVFDSETRFIKDANLYEIYANVGMSKKLKANLSEKGGSLIRKISEKMNLQNNENLIRETEDFSLYWWFNEIPVYSSKSFREFWAWLETHGIENFLDDYWCFDYLLYSIWGICFENFKVQKITLRSFDWGAIESINLESNYMYEINEVFSSYWATISPIEKTVLLFHQDQTT